MSDTDLSDLSDLAVSRLEALADHIENPPPNHRFRYLDMSAWFSGLFVREGEVLGSSACVGGEAIFLFPDPGLTASVSEDGALEFRTESGEITEVSALDAALSALDLPASYTGIFTLGWWPLNLQEGYLSEPRRYLARLLRGVARGEIRPVGVSGYLREAPAPEIPAPAPAPTPAPPRLDGDLRWFDSRHLPPNLAEVVRPFQDLAARIAPEGEPLDPQTASALHYLLLAKDCAVRGHIARKEAGDA